MKDTKSEPSPDSEFATALFSDFPVSRTVIVFLNCVIINHHPVNGSLLEQPGQTMTLVYRCYLKQLECPIFSLFLRFGLHSAHPISEREK